MFDTIRDAAKIGVGAILLSRDNLKKITDELTEMGKVSKEEGERLFNELNNYSADYKKKLSENIEAAVAKALDTAGLAKKSEVDELRQRVTELEAAVKGEEEVT